MDWTYWRTLLERRYLPVCLNDGISEVHVLVTSTSFSLPRCNYKTIIRYSKVVKSCESQSKV